MGRSYVLAAVLAVFLFGGCQKMPDLGNAQESQVAEYAAGILLKYDSSYQKRLKDVDSALAWEESRAAMESRIAAMQSQESQAAESAQAGTEGGSEASSEAAQSVYTSTPEILLQLPEGVGLRLLDATVESHYADPSAGAFALEPTAGNGFLAVKIALFNNGSGAADVDILGSGAVFKLILGGGQSRTALVTMLSTDLSTFSGQLAAGESREMVVLAEFPQEALHSISSLQVAVSSPAGLALVQSE